MATNDRSPSQASTQCQNCNNYVTPQFARVFGDNDNSVHACIECSTLHALRDGDGGETSP